MGNLQQDIENMVRLGLSWIRSGGAISDPVDEKQQEHEAREMIEITAKPLQTHVSNDVRSAPMDDALITAPPKHQPRLFVSMRAPGLTLEGIQTVNQQEALRLDKLVTDIRACDDASKRQIMHDCLTAPDSRLVQAMSYSLEIDAFFKDPAFDDLWAAHLNHKGYKDRHVSHDEQHCQHWYRCYLNEELNQWAAPSWRNHPQVASLKQLCQSLNAAVMEPTLAHELTAH